MKKKVVIVLLTGCMLLLGACSNANNFAKAYGSFEYINSDGSASGIVIDKEAVQFENVDMDELKNMKVAFEVQKEVAALEREGVTVDEQKKEDIRQKLNQEFEWSGFGDAKFEYTAEYEEDSQTVYFESVTGNQNELFFSYDLNTQKLSIYNVEFAKASK
ncbi:MAG: hypothetical protein E7292_06570 [Lachnospiraceae bacterium]|nr:hypothetical protein [Lachnospiraceae bacterium]